MTDEQWLDDSVAVVPNLPETAPLDTALTQAYLDTLPEIEGTLNGTWDDADAFTPIGMACSYEEGPDGEPVVGVDVSLHGPIKRGGNQHRSWVTCKGTVAGEEQTVRVVYHRG